MYLTDFLNFQILLKLFVPLTNIEIEISQIVIFNVSLKQTISPKLNVYFEA